MSVWKEERKKEVKREKEIKRGKEIKRERKGIAMTLTICNDNLSISRLDGSCKQRVGPHVLGPLPLDILTNGNTNNRFVFRGTFGYLNTM